MKLTLSSYLKRTKPYLKQLRDQLLVDYQYVSILGTDSKGKVYRVSRTGTSIGTSSLSSNRGFVVKVYDGTSYCEYAFDTIDATKIDEIVACIKEHLVPMAKTFKAPIQMNSTTCLEEEACTFSGQTEYVTHPKAMGDEAIISALQKMSNAMLSRDARIVDAYLVYEYSEISKVFLSEKKDLEQCYMWSNGVLMAIASEEGEVQEGFFSYSNQGGAELLEVMQQGIDNTVQRALTLLGTQPIPAGEYDVICDCEVTGLIAHEAFGHGVEMDMFVKDRALAKQYMGKMVASPLVTMHDGAKPSKDTGSYFFDDEGMMAHDTVIIDKGKLVCGLNDCQTAMQLQVAPTGNGRRESYERKAYTRMTNTYFESGESTLEEMVASISYGFYLQGYTSGMEDPKNWGIQCMLTLAHEIKDGQLTGKVYSPVIMTGYVPDLLKSITMVSKDFELFGAGYCGKGYKEFVKTSVGGPMIKARAQLS